ncbi:unnamed protein product [Auanema sp. JU1783]|nr:unnamed protein product [Auanema sp. JU1783]
MLAARGVSLGLGKINLSDLNELPGDRKRRYEQKKEEQPSKPRIRIKKKADAKTVWAACRAVMFGSIIIVIGLAMTIIGYFDKHFSQKVTVIEGIESYYYDKFIQYQLKSMQYLGPILMGVGAFILIIACVVTLESRDRHTQIISEDSHKRRRLLSEVDEEQHELIVRKRSTNQVKTFAEIHQPQIGLAPLADFESVDIHSCCSELTTDRDVVIQMTEK